MTPLQQQFTANLRALRESRGLSQERLAELVGLSMPFIAHIETGRKSPSFETLEILAQALKVPAYRFLMPQLPMDEALIDQATSELRDVVKKVFNLVDAHQD
jgi:transcriptional regulator with XRE-family HTH domain